MFEIRPKNHAVNIFVKNNDVQKKNTEICTGAITNKHEINHVCFWRVKYTDIKNADPLKDPLVKMKTLMSLVSLLNTTGASSDSEVQKKISEVRGMLADALSSGSAVTEAEYYQKIAELYSAIANSKHKTSGGDDNSHRDKENSLPSVISNRRIKEIKEDISSSAPDRLLSEHIPENITGLLE